MTKKIPCCSYCEKPGHRINKCTDPAIQKLLQEAEEACIISYAFYNEWNPKRKLDTRECVKTWLKEIHSSELKVLAYRFKVPQDKKTCLYFLPRKLYNKWVVPYEEGTICGKMTLFSDENLEMWQDFLCKNFRLSPQNVSYRIRELCYPSHKFSIDTKHCDPSNPTETDCPICFANLTLENTVKTGCNHEYCNQCLFQYMRSESKNKSALSCPLCRDSIKIMHTSEKETRKILTTRFCKPIPPPLPPLSREENYNDVRPAPTPILMSQLIQQDRATEARKKFYKKVMEAMFWVFVSAIISSLLTKVMKICA